MKFTTENDPLKFYDVTYQHLLKKEAIHNVPLGIISGLKKRPDLYDNFYGIYSKSADTGLQVGFMTPPYPIFICEMSQQALSPLIDELLTWNHKITGVIGRDNIPYQFLEEWNKKLGAEQVYKELKERLFVLEKVSSIRPSDGEIKLVTLNDIDLLKDWALKFNIECDLPAGDSKQTEKLLLKSIEDGEFYFWVVDDIPVCMASARGHTPKGVRIGYVYTPKSHRGKGYASNLVAKMSQTQLDNGKSFCTLYADTKNPTSNKIYEAIGYKPIENVSRLLFVE